MYPTRKTASFTRRSQSEEPRFNNALRLDLDVINGLTSPQETVVSRNFQGLIELQIDIGRTLRMMDENRRQRFHQQRASFEQVEGLIMFPRENSERIPHIEVQHNDAPRVNLGVLDAITLEMESPPYPQERSDSPDIFLEQEITDTRSASRIREERRRQQGFHQQRARNEWAEAAMLHYRENFERTNHRESEHNDADPGVRDVFTLEMESPPYPHERVDSPDLRILDEIQIAEIQLARVIQARRRLRVIHQQLLQEMQEIHRRRARNELCERIMLFNRENSERIHHIEVEGRPDLSAPRRLADSGMELQSAEATCGDENPDNFPPSEQAITKKEIAESEEQMFQRILGKKMICDICSVHVKLYRCRRCLNSMCEECTNRITCKSPGNVECPYCRERQAAFEPINLPRM